MHGSSTPRVIAAVFAVGLSGCIVQQAPPKNQEQSQQTQPQQQAVAQNTKPTPATKAAVAPTAPAKQQAGAPAPAPAAPTASRTYTIKPGDSLWNISKEVYGDPIKYQRILDANPGLNPDNMKPGTKIVIP